MVRTTVRLGAVGGAVGVLLPAAAVTEVLSAAGGAWLGGAAWLAIVPTCSPAPTMALTASSSLCPTRSGMTNELRSSGAASSTLIFGADTLVALAGGLC